MQRTGAVIVIAATLTACGSNEPTRPPWYAGGTGGTATSIGAEVVPPDDGATAHPPPDPGGPPGGRPSSLTLALQRLYLGDTDRQLNADSGAWQSFGYDLDGHYSSKRSTSHCAPRKGANPALVKSDGYGGIDNSWGANLIPILRTLSSGLSEDATNDILAGGPTLVFRFANKTESLTQSPVSASLLRGAQLPSAPTWDGADVWPIFEDSTNGFLERPKVGLPSYVVAGTWVAHATAPITLTFQLGEFPLEFRIHNAIISAKVSGPAAKGGIIAGVLDPEEVLPVFAKVAGAIYAPLCDPVDFESIAVQVRATSDIMLDGSNGDPTQICNGISLGIGFDAAAVQLGPLVPPAPDLPDPCAG